MHLAATVRTDREEPLRPFALCFHPYLTHRMSCREEYTTVGSMEGDGRAHRIDWRDPLRPFLVREPNALLCIELRDKRQGKKTGPDDELTGAFLSCAQFDRIGAVRNGSGSHSKVA